MTIAGGRPLSWFPAGVSDCLDSTPVFPGAMSSLANIIPDPTTKNVWQCRPASSLAVDFAITGGAFSSAFSSAFQLGIVQGAGFVSVMKIVGTRCYGMIASTQFTSTDVPFCFDLASGLFVSITGATAANTPTSPATTGAWTPPTMDLIGTKLIVTHPGYNAGGGFYFGVIDISNPAAVTYTAQNTTTNALAALPSAVKQFNGRAWFIVNPTTGQPGLYYSDALNATVITNGTQVLTFGDNIPLTALGQLPLNNLGGGVIQSLIVFKGATNLYQITGDAATSNLLVNALNQATGTLASNTICTTPKGLAFVAPDGLRIIDFMANVSDPIGISGTGITVPFLYSVVPSRMAAACNLSIVRISTQNGAKSGNPQEEYWYDAARQLWTGPHSFPASLIQPYASTFVLTPQGVSHKLFQSNVMQNSTSTFVENSTQMTFSYTTSFLPNTGQLAVNYVSETSIDLALNSSVPGFAVAATDMDGAALDAVSLTVSGGTTVWGAFTWGSATWGGATSALRPRKIPWTKPIVTQQMTINVQGQCASAVKFGKFYMRYSVLGYIPDEAAA